MVGPELGDIPGYRSSQQEAIGIVGGIAWPSSIVYYRIIKQLVAQRLGAERRLRAGAEPVSKRYNATSASGGRWRASSGIAARTRCCPPSWRAAE
jgi:hypothetical protein